MSIYIGNDLEDRLEALETENASLRKYNEYHQMVHEIDRCRKRLMSTIVNSFVNDKLCNDQLVYDFVRRKYRLVHPSLEQNIVKQISR